MFKQQLRVGLYNELKVLKFDGATVEQFLASVNEIDAVLRKAPDFAFVAAQASHHFERLITTHFKCIKSAKGDRDEDTSIDKKQIWTSYIDAMFTADSSYSLPLCIAVMRTSWIDPEDACSVCVRAYEGSSQTKLKAIFEREYAGQLACVEKTKDLTPDHLCRAKSALLVNSILTQARARVQAKVLAAPQAPSARGGAGGHGPA